MSDHASQTHGVKTRLDYSRRDSWDALMTDTHPAPADTVQCESLFLH